MSWANNGISSGALNVSTAHQTLVGKLTDSYAPISTTASAGSAYAVRIGNGVNGAGAESLTKTFVVTQATMNFSYALVLEDPGHDASYQPRFAVRVLNSSGADITKQTAASAPRPPRVFLTSTGNEVASDASNPFFKVSPTTGPNFAKVVYKDWTCTSIDLGDLMGQTVTVEFITEDCAAGGHAGWAYIDDVCGTSCNAPDGTVTLNQAASSSCGPGKLCFDFTVAKTALGLGTTQLSLQTYQNGLAVGAPTSSPVLSANGQYCFSVPTSGLNPALGGFDWVVTSANKIGNTMLAPKFVGTMPNGVTVGANNDYLLNCPQSGNTCCPPLNNATIMGLFGHSGNAANTYTEQFGGGVQGAAALTAFYSNYNAYLAMLKWSCPNVDRLQVSFHLFQTTALGGPFTSPLATNTLTFNGGAVPVGSTAFFNQPLSNGQVYGIQAITTPLGANGKPVSCGYDRKCLEDDRFTWVHSVGAKMSSQAPVVGP